ncbi:MAG: hypothetical protein KDB88_14275 [Flavobacteriales bacterium]|nr:hypothetical protein [Flavobacteriales bacterium]
MMSGQSNGKDLPGPGLTRSSHQHQRVNERPWVQWTIVVGILAAVVTFLTVGKVTLVAWDLMFRLLLACCSIPLLVPYRYSGANLGFERVEWALLLALGLGPMLFSAILITNRFLHGDATCTTHEVAQVVYTGYIWRVALVDSPMASYPAATEHYLDPEVQRGSTYELCTGKGCFGVAVLVRQGAVDGSFSAGPPAQ